jgi:hypothetical protein
MAEPFEIAIDQAVTMTGINQVINLEGTSLAEITSISVPTSSVPDIPGFRKDLNSEFTNRYVSLDAIKAKEDGSDLAYMRVLKFNNGKFGKQVFPLDNNNVAKYKEFIVTSLAFSFVEKTQILKTNNTLQVYAFDSQPEVIGIQGLLKSNMNDKWDMAMLLIWDELIRLTKLVQQNLIVEFGYESNVYWGYPLNFTYQKSSSAMYLASFSMQFLIIKRSIIMRQENAFITGIIDQLNDITSVNQ